MRLRQISRLVFVAYFLEVGLLLVVIPWSAFWDRNVFGVSVPWLGTFMRNDFMRGAVTGLGIVNLWTGVMDLVALMADHRRAAALVSQHGGDE